MEKQLGAWIEIGTSAFDTIRLRPRRRPQMRSLLYLKGTIRDNASPVDT